HGRLELYDVAHDISESTNLIDRDAERAGRMAAKLADWRRTVEAQLTQPNPGFVPDTQAADGMLTLPGKHAEMHGVMVRYEPLPHKRTIGFWTRADDWVSWEFAIARPGVFQVEILAGCGSSSGGSQVDFTVGDQTLATTVEETGGFQKFVPRTIGTFK